MNALADKVHKQEVPRTQWYALHIMTTLFKNHPYVSSSNLHVVENYYFFCVRTSEIVVAIFIITGEILFLKK